MLRDHPRMREKQPFEFVLQQNNCCFSLFLILRSIQVKEVNFSYSIDKVFSDITNLQHGNDGLIYTSVSTPYIPGTDKNLSVFFSL